MHFVTDYAGRRVNGFGGFIVAGRYALTTMHSPVTASGVLRASSSVSSLHRILWPQGLATHTSTPWLNQSQRAAAWWSLVSIASIDIAYPIPVLRDLWWCVWFVLWAVPWRQPVASSPAFFGTIEQLSTLVFFPWLIYRTQMAVLASINTWKVFGGIHWWELLSYPIQNTLASIVTASLVVMQLQRVTRRSSAFAATLAALPLSVILCVPSVFSLSRWATHPTLCAIDVYDAVIPLLVIGEAASLRGRRQRRVEADRSLSRGGALYLAIMTGRLNALAALGVYCILTLLATASGLLLWRVSGDHLYETPLAAAGRAMAFPAIGFLAALAAVGCWRSLDRAGRRHVVLSNIATVGHIAIGASICVFALLGLLFAPRSANVLREAIQNMGGSPWSITSTSPDTVRLSGKLTNGVRNALEKALADNSNIRRLELDSTGGYVDEGLTVAAVVEQHSLSTVVRRMCASACTEIFVAGKERILESGGQLGFHRTRGTTWDTSPRETDRSDDQVAEQFRAHGISEVFIHHALNVPSAEMWYPSVSELLAAGVITANAARSPEPAVPRRAR